MTPRRVRGRRSNKARSRLDEGTYGSPRSYLEMRHGASHRTARGLNRVLYDKRDPQWGVKFLTPRTRRQDKVSLDACRSLPNLRGAGNMMATAYTHPLGKMAHVRSRVFDKSHNLDYLHRHRYVPQHRPPAGSMMHGHTEVLNRPELGPGAYHSPTNWKKGGVTIGTRRGESPAFIAEVCAPRVVLAKGAMMACCTWCVCVWMCGCVNRYRRANTFSFALQAEKRGREAVPPPRELERTQSMDMDYYNLGGKTKKSPSFRFGKAKADRCSHVSPKHLSQTVSHLSLQRVVRPHGDCYPTGGV